MNAAKILLTVGFVVAAFGVLAHVQAEGEVGVVAQPGESFRIGDRAPDFDFYAANGKRVRLSHIRGDVSIVAIVRSDNPDICPIAANVLLLADKYSGLETAVRFICVSEPPDGMCDLNANIVKKCGLASMRVIGLCDAGGRVRSIFRTGEAGVYFLIDGDGKIAAMGKLGDLHDMEKALRKAVSAYEADLPGPYDDH